MTDIDRIVKFFLHIFQLQSDVAGELEGKGEYRLVPSDTDSTLIYELRTRLHSGWKSRRMSLRQLGETVESKSTCYVVTYDDLLVIKIPPSPLADFNIYLSSINIEREISKQLSPSIHCLSPSLSSILSRVPELVSKLSPEEVQNDEAYLRLLTKEPRYQGFLKIGDRFAFFMSLSKHPFFDQITQKIHMDKKTIQNEILKHVRCFMSLEAFESVYGSSNVDLYFHINELYKEFGGRIDELVAEDGNACSIPEYQRQEWVFAALCDKHPAFDAGEFPDKICDDINRLLSQLISKRQVWVDAYRKTVTSYIHKKNFDKNRSKIELLIIITLELICQLSNLGVAARDLKPENILVLGDFLEGPSEPEDRIAMSLGLIDLETAVKIEAEEPEQTLQPMLAGTPSYMTPAQVFKNNELIAVFGKEIARTFLMQDWFAVVAIIFDIATGKSLFQKTARLIPEIIRVQKKGMERKTPMTEIFANVSKIFWKTASEELLENIDSHRQILDEIHLMLPDHLTDFFKFEIERENAILKNLIKKCVHSEKILSRNPQKLIDANYDMIRNLRIKWEKGDLQTPLSADSQEKIIHILKVLEDLKLRLYQNDLSVLHQKRYITCEEMMVFLFERVLNAMNRPAWCGDI